MGSFAVAGHIWTVNADSVSESNIQNGILYFPSETDSRNLDFAITPSGSVLHAPFPVIASSVIPLRGLSRRQSFRLRYL